MAVRELPLSNLLSNIKTCSTKISSFEKQIAVRKFVVVRIVKINHRVKLIIIVEIIENI